MTTPYEPRPGNDRPFWDVATQTMDRGQLRELQERRLREAIERVFSKPVPFFRRKLEAAGITGPGDVTSLEGLDAVPVTVKQELRESEAEHPPIGDYRATDLRDNVMVGTSTGTTGTPTVALWTKRDVEVDCEAGARMFWGSGVRPGHIITHAHPAYLYAGGPLQTMAYQHFGVLCLWVPPPDSDETAEQGLRMWQRITPDFPLMGFSTGTFLTHAKRLGIAPEDVGLDFSKLPNLGSTPGGPLGLMTAGAECFPYLGAACANRLGSHLAEDFTHVQALGEDGKPVPDGEWGRLVVTTFGRDNFLIRYDLEEAAKLDASDCGCGATHKRGWWGGRFKDLLATQGKSLMLNDIDAAIGSVAAVRTGGLQYVIVRPTDTTADEPLRLRVEVGEGYDGDRGAVRTALVGAFQERLGVKAEPEILDRDTLPRASYKATRIVDA
ncbi:MAG TPA: hypothetical protein VG708_04365 [Mycobacteriales bacterium]|nr:hypothetical protein [Mycobacteriales bacterium]